MKKQEQRLRDLQKTLHRELKVQPLPSDEPVIIDGAAQTPPMQRKVNDSRNSPFRDGNDYRELSPMSMGHVTKRELSPAMIGHEMRQLELNSVSNHSKDSHGAKVLNDPRKELENDVNFKYLKHVVLKFMLSREAEVSTYLNQEH